MSLLESHPYYQLDWGTMPKIERAKRRDAARAWAEATLKYGDTLIVARCGSRSRYIMVGWDDGWIVSKSGFNGIHPLSVLRVNGCDANNPGHATV